MCVWSVNSQIFRVEEFDFHCREFLNNNKHVIACRMGMVHRSQNAQIDDLLTFLYTVELERDRQWLNGTQCENFNTSASGPISIRCNRFSKQTVKQKPTAVH